MTTVTGSITLKNFSKKIFDAIGDDFDQSTDLTEDDYINIREKINAAISVGAIEEFSGYVREETWINHVTEVVEILFSGIYPSEDCSTSQIYITLHQQRDFRDKLISELDAMVER